ncbi:MAG: nucleotidyltransferase family protein [Lachnospiraceae bacterium]|nr:nucleotidyltransferase family protein [Lachnospiraceae bacterium]
MKITGIIAEFNPFHNGHQYILEKARVLTGCEKLVVAMSGDFVQRGAPAILDKGMRAKCALMNGADLVVQLPVVTSTGSARDFAYGGVKTLAACGVDTLVFGCEWEDVELLRKFADILYTEPEAFKSALQQGLKAGKNYPTAQTEALLACMDTANSLEEDTFSRLLREPNTILGLEYMRAIKELGLSMVTLPVKRTGVSHHGVEVCGSFASASYLRSRLLDCDSPAHVFKELKELVPANIRPLYEEQTEKQPLLSELDYEKVLYYKLLLAYRTSSTPAASTSAQPSFLDATDEILNRLQKELSDYRNFAEYLDRVTTKDVTRGRMLRIITHILLDLTTELGSFFRETELPYVRVLGVKKDARPLLGEIAKKAPVITSVAEGEQALLKETACDANRTHSVLTLLASDIFAREVYLMLTKTKGDAVSLPNDYRLPIQII